jgi:hypothetical protein
MTTPPGDPAQPCLYREYRSVFVPSDGPRLVAFLRGRCIGAALGAPNVVNLGLDADLDVVEALLREWGAQGRAGG